MKVTWPKCFKDKTERAVYDAPPRLWLGIDLKGLLLPEDRKTSHSRSGFNTSVSHTREVVMVLTRWRTLLR